MTPGIIINPEGTKSELGQGIELLLAEAKGIVNILANEIDGNAQQLAFTLTNHIEILDDMWDKYQDAEE